MIAMGIENGDYGRRTKENPACFIDIRTANFPPISTPEITNAFNHLPESIKSLLPDIPGNFHYVRAVAYLPVLLACQSVLSRSVAYQQLGPAPRGAAYRIRPGLFQSYVFNLVQAHCWLTLNP